MSIEIQWPETIRTQLVLIEGLRYKRYVGRKCTNIVITEEPLDKEWIEIFRTDPRKLYPDQPPPLRYA